MKRSVLPSPFSWSLRTVITPSLSVVLPVYNAEHTLRNQVHQLLDLLPDLTHDFEILVINDGSTDQTDEVGCELAREFPQVRIVHHALRRGHAGAVETGLAKTDGEVMFVQDEHAPIDSSKFHRLWALRDEEDVVFARPEFSVKKSLLQRLAAWGVRLEDASQNGGNAGVQMIRRNGLARIDEVEPVGSRRMTRADQPTPRRDSHPVPKFPGLRTSGVNVPNL